MRCNSAAAALAASCLITLSLNASTLISNRIKYSDTSISSTTGRSGTATLSARALINRDGSADLDLTTGDFEQTTARGSIDKVQVKVAGDPGARNYNDLSNAGALTLSLDSVPRHGTVDVQANVRDYDRNRNDVVEVSPVAGLRPDLVAGAVSAPQYAFLGVPTMIFASIQERNGDNGARANCVLSVNGAEVDRADGVWVDAKDSVACRFVHAFDNVGVQQIAVSAANVSPADWDDSNNSASASIEVVKQMPSWTASAHEETWTRWEKFQAPWQKYETTSSGWEALSNFVGFVNNADVDFSKLHIGFRQTSGGTVFADVANLPELPVNPGYPQCKEFDDERVYVWACNPGWPKNFPYEDFDPKVMSIQAGRSSMNIVYHSAGTNLRGEQFDEGYTQVQGTQAPYGDSVHTTVVVFDDTNKVIGDALIELTPFTRSIDTPYRCRGPICSGQTDETTGKDGRASFNW